MKHLSFSAARRGCRTAITCAIIAALAAPALHLPAMAANHPLSAVGDINTIDYVVNVDWDYDAAPVQANNPAQRLDRAYIMDVLRVTAQSIFTMTEGRHRLGNVFIYRNKKFAGNVDIQMINKEDRSSANVSGWTSRGTSSFNYLAFSKTFESKEALGKVIAHELGHYTYGLYDEYQEAGKKLDAADPGSPSEADTPKDTMMHDHLRFVSLSTPADYADADKRQTAQARMARTANSQGSAWEMLTRPASEDPDASRSAGRTFFEAFRGIDPKTLQLTKPVQGFDAKLNFVFAPEPVFRDVIVIDRSLPAGRFAELIQGAKTLVSQAKADSQFAIVASPGATTPVLGMTTADEAGKQALAAALDALQPAASGSFEALPAFTQGFNLVAAARKPGDPSAFHLLTGSETSVPVEAATTARTARIAVSPLGLTGGNALQRLQKRSMAVSQSLAGGAVSLASLAQQTGGSYNTAKDGAEAAKDLTRAAKETHSEAYATLQLDSSDALRAGAAFESVFRVASGATDGAVNVDVTFDPADAALLRYSLTAPSGAVYATNALPAGVAFDLDAAEGYASFSIAPGAAGRTGVWKLVVSSSSAMRDGLAMEVSSDAEITLTGEVEGGTAGAATAPLVRVRLGAQKSVKLAQLRADVFREDGTRVLKDVLLRDDGISPDGRAGDGQYAVSLASQLAAGEYYAVVTARTDASSRIASLGALVRGERAEEAPVELLERVAVLSFSLEAGAPGVGTSGTGTPPTGTAPPPAGTAPGASAGDSGGGCTTTAGGNDAGLVALLLAALAGLALRRRNSGTRRQA